MGKASTKSPEGAAAAIAKECLAMRVRYLNRSLTAVYDDAFRPLGITASQVNMLVAIVNRGTLSPSELGNLLNIEKSTLSRNLERIRKAGWIKITTPSSGRTNTVHPTDRGKKLLLEVLPRWREAQRAAAGLLGDEGSETLREIGDHARGELTKR